MRMKVFSIPLLWEFSRFSFAPLRFSFLFQLVILSQFNFNLVLVYADRPIISPSDEKSPSIQLVEWHNSENEYGYYGSTVFRNDTDLYSDEIKKMENNTWVIYQNVASVTFSCTAPYPIQWSRETDEIDDMDETFYSRGGKCFRTAGNISDPKTFTFKVDLQFRSQSSKNAGFYRCESVENTRTASEMYLFFEGITATIFPEAELHHVLSIGVNNQKSLVLPCFTSLPNIPVILSRRTLFGSPDTEIFKEFLPVQVDNQILSFDSKTGFTIDVLNFPKLVDAIEGTYKCSTNYTDDTNDHLIIHVIAEYYNNSGSNFQEFVRGNASFYLERAQHIHTITCCSATHKTPTLATLFCGDPISCRFFYPRMSKDKNPNFRQGRVNGNCVTEEIFPSEFGIFACYGDGIQAVRHLYSTEMTPDGDFKMYAGWAEVEPEFMILISFWPEQQNVIPPGEYHSYWQPLTPEGTNPDPLNTVYYAGETLVFSCSPHLSYFASGTKWMVEWKNQTKTELKRWMYNEFGLVPFDEADEIKTDFWSHDFYNGLRINLNLNVSEEMENIKCLAPVWNSTKWIEKSVKIKVKPSSLLDWDCRNVNTDATYWALGSSAQISCSIKAVPLASFKIFKDDRPLLNTSDYDIKVLNVTKKVSMVTVQKSKVTHDNHGVFTLVANNFAGEKKINIVVFVDEPENWAAILAIMFMLILCVLGLSFLAWKFVLQKRLKKTDVNISYVNYKSDDEE